METELGMENEKIKSEMEDENVQEQVATQMEDEQQASN